MERTAASLGRRARLRKPLPTLLVFTDPVRTPDPEALARGLSPGAALVYRSFGAPGAEATARRLQAILFARGALLLIGADAGLATRVGADGVHLPERLAARAQGMRGRFRLVTAAAHSLRAARVPGPDAVVVSAVFPSSSASAGAPMGPVRFAALVRAAGRPVYALGGVTNETARRLLSTGAAGLAGIEAFRT
jgi:thiamine-phosphate pyrophosphorylase